MTYRDPLLNRWDERVTAMAEEISTTLEKPVPLPVDYYRVGQAIGIPIRATGSFDERWAQIAGHIAWLEGCEPEEIATFDAYWGESSYCEFITKRGDVVGALDRFVGAEELLAAAESMRAKR